MRKTATQARNSPPRLNRRQIKKQMSSQRSQIKKQMSSERSAAESKDPPTNGRGLARRATAFAFAPGFCSCIDLLPLLSRERHMTSVVPSATQARNRPSRINDRRSKNKCHLNRGQIKKQMSS
jgi:hypothetical protein